MRYFLIFILCLFIFSSCKNSKNEIDEIDTINFTYNGGMRIAYNNLKINIEKSIDKTIVFVYSNPIFDVPKWNYSKIDTSFYINVNVFNQLAKSLTSLNKIDSKKAHLIGKDGYICKLEFGTMGKYKSYEYWTPNINIKERGLTDFVKISNQLIEIAGLKDENLIR